MIKIAIVEDDHLYQTKITTMIEKIVLDVESKTTCFLNATEFLNSKKDFDLILLDIDLPDMNGIEIAKRLEDENVIIIYITNHKHFSENAYGINVYKYILKTKLEQLFPKTLKEIINKLENRKITQFNTEDGIVNFNRSEIVYILLENKKITLYTKDKKYILKDRTFKSVFEKLPSNYLKINKDIIINSKYIKSIKDDTVMLELYDIKLPYSRRSKKQIVDTFNRQVNKL